MAKRKVIHVVFKKDQGKWLLRGGDGNVHDQDQGGRGGKEAGQGGRKGPARHPQEDRGDPDRVHLRIDPRRSKG